MDPMSEYILSMLADAKIAEFRKEAAHDGLARRMSAGNQPPARDVLRATFAGVAAAAGIVLIVMFSGK